MQNYKQKEFIQWVIKKRGNPEFTGSQAILADELINSIEDNLALKNVLIQVGNKTKVFELIREFYREFYREC